MKIGIVSDTHSLALPSQMLEDFLSADLIIHAGDFCCWEDLENFKKIKEVQAVHGNMDEMKIRRFFPRKQILKFGSVAVGLFHGEGSRGMILETVKTEFAEDKVDCIIFGHSHQPLNETMERILFFNPGSPNDTISAPYRSYGILEVKNKKIVGKIVKVK